MIDLADIGPDDYVIIQDVAGNVASGTVQRVPTAHRTTLAIRAFGTVVPFAQLSRRDTWRAIPGIKVTGHTPVLMGADFDDG
jgi:hypothetical protein